MAEVKWIKLAIDVFDNRKIKQIEAMPDGDTIIVIWLKLLILAGTINDGGVVYFTRDIPYTDQLLSTQFNRPLATIQLALRTFEQFGMIEVHDDVIYVSNWEKYQNIEGMDKIREQTRKRVAEYRERRKIESGNVTVTQRNATEEDKKEEDKSKSKKEKAFTRPSLQEVTDYCNERNNTVDPAAFIDFYESKGWKVGNQPMKDWKAAVRTWERRRTEKPTEPSNRTNYKGREYTDEELENFYVKWEE